MGDLATSLDAHIPALRRYARSLRRDVQDADDLVHDTLARALDAVRPAHAQANARAWLFTIMHNLFVSDLRRARVRGETALPEDDSGLGAQAPDQEARLRWQEVLRALDRLPPEQRHVLLLISVEDLSYAETAAVLGVPIGTVMSRLSRGRERLRVLMEAPAEPRPVLRRVK